MRVKHKKWAEPLIEAHPEKITTDPAQFKGKWQSRFAKRLATSAFLAGDSSIPAV